MNIIVIDDEPAPLLTFASHILDNAAVTANMFSLKVDEALEFARTHEHKAVFLDIKMPSINGVELAEKFIEINPDVRIIFITGYAQNIREIKRRVGKNLFAFCYKPYDAATLNSILTRLADEENRSVSFRTFPRFDCFSGSVPVDFGRAKAKELLALLVDRRGGFVTMEEVITALWQEKTANLSKQLYRDAVCRLRLTLNEYGAGHILNVKRARLALKTRYCSCDMWDFIDGKVPDAFRGEYMRPYEWAIKTEAHFAEKVGKP